MNIKNIKLPPQKTDSLMEEIIREILTEELPEEWKAYHLDSFAAKDESGEMQYRFQGIFTLGPTIMHAPLSVLRKARRYQIMEGKGFFIYTIWLDV